MLRATLRGLLARKLRLLLSGLAVVLGVAFVSGTFVLTDTLGKVFDSLIASTSTGTDVAVRAAGDAGDRGDREPVPDAVLQQVRKVPGVADAIGNTFSASVALVGKDGKKYEKQGPPVVGVSFQPASPQESLRVKRGTAPVGRDQVALDRATFDDLHLQLGDRIGVIGNGPVQQATVTAVVGFEKADSFAGASLVAVDAPTAQVLFGVPGTWSALSVRAEEGISPAELRDRISQALPKGQEAVTQQQADDEQGSDLEQGLKFFNIFLLVFAGVALFVGMFLIFNTFSMLVAQRVRELALMRALGASRRQVTSSVLVEALVVGVVSSVTGLLAGIGVASGLRALLGAIGLEIPGGPAVVATRTVVVSLVLGVVVTLVAALVPARRAARVAPVQAMRESGPAEDRSLRRRTLLGSALLVLGVLALVPGLRDGNLPLLGLGAVVCFLSVATLSPLFARPVVSFLGLPFTRIGVPGRLGRSNAVRSPRRTSATAAALMIGLALVAMVSTLGESAKKSLVSVVETSLGADYVLHTDQYQPFSPAAAKGLQGRPELAAVGSFAAGEAEVGSAGRVGVLGIDADDLVAVLKLDVVDGDLADLDRGLAVSEREAEALDVSVGDRVPVTWARTGESSVPVVAVYAENQFIGGYLVSDRTIAANVTKPQLDVIAVKRADSATPDQARAAVEAGLKAFPNVEVEDRAQFVQAQGDQVDSLLNIITVLLVFSVLIAVLGIVNTLALSVVERTRELGLLRAVGLQRRQLRRMIRVESVLVAVYGAVLGILIGLAFGAATVKALEDEGLSEFAVPWARLGLVLVAAALAGVLAAALPARRAAKMDVLAAIATA